MTGAARGSRPGTFAVLLAVLLGAALLRVAHGLEVSRNDVLARVPAGDERTFAEGARRVATGSDDTVPYQAPLYPHLLGALERVSGDPPFAAARALQAVLALVAAGVAGWLAAHLTGDRRAAVVAFALTALAKPLVAHEGYLLREAPSAVLLAVIAYAYVRARERESWEDHAALGLALGLGVVLRENFSVVALAVGVERGASFARGAGAERRRRFAAGAALLLGLGLPILPFDQKVARLGDGWHLLPHWNQGCVFYLANRRDNASQGGYEAPPFVAVGNPEGEARGFRAEAARRAGRPLGEHETGDFWLRAGLEEIAADPLRFGRRVLFRALLSFVPWETAHQRDPDLDAETSWVLRAPLPGLGALLALALAGAIATGRRPGKGDSALLLLVLAWWSSFLLAAFTTRYRVPAIPLLAALGGRGGLAIAGSLRARRWRRVALLLAPGLVVNGLLPLGRPPHDSSNARRTRALAHLEAGEPARAAADLEVVVKLRASDPGALTLLGQACLAAHDAARARAVFARATRLAPDLADAWRGLGSSELVLRRPGAAAEAFEGGLERCPDDPWLSRALATARRNAEGRRDAPLPPRARDDP